MSAEIDVVDSMYESGAAGVTTSSVILIKDFVRKWRYGLSSEELKLQFHDHVPIDCITNDKNKIPDEILEELFIITRFVALSMLYIRLNDLKVTGL